MAGLGFVVSAAGLLLAALVLVTVLSGSPKSPQEAEARRLLEDGDIGALVVLTGNQHSETNKWTKDASGAFYKQRILTRPGWQKTTRCTGPSRDSCEECWGDSDCWAPRPASRTVSSTSAGAAWSRFVSTLHVRCNAPTIAVDYEVLNLQGGELRFFWDNMEISPQSGFATHGLTSPISEESVVQQSVSGGAVIEVMQRGGHTLEVEFVVHQGAVNASAELSKLELIMPEDYAQCEDFKACLDPLASSPGTQELRSSNALQLACLEGPSTDECLMWQYCLVESNRREAIHALLRAGGVGSVTLASTGGRRLQQSTTATTTAEPATTATTTAEPATTATTTAEPATSATTTAEPAASATTTEPATTVTTTAEQATSATTTAEPATSATTTAEPASSATTTAEPVTTATTTAELATSTSSTAVPANTASSTAVPATTAASSTTSAEPAEPAEESNACLNPLVEDVESWACDCYDEMQSRCAQLSSEPFYSHELCMRAIVCDHPRVCTEWKAAACSTADPGLNIHRSKLQQRRLMERSSSSAPGAATPFLAPRQQPNMDRALGEKQCV